MSTLHKVSEADKAQARKTGKLPKAPKKPKKGSSVTTLERYVDRHNAYVKKIKDMAHKASKKATLSKQIFGA